jgi:hypothetical protein
VDKTEASTTRSLRSRWPLPASANCTGRHHLSFDARRGSGRRLVDVRRILIIVVIGG